MPANPERDQLRLGTERIGRWGAALLVVSGVLGVVLAVHGYGAGAGTASSVIAGPVATAGAGQHHPTRGSRPGSGSATTSTAPAPGHTSQKLGPPLSSSAYARYAYQLYPASMSSQAAAATAGFSVKVTPGSGSFSLSVSAVGTSTPPRTSSYPTGDRVYFVETSLGDDSNDSDYNFGDDGVVITDAKGRIVQ